MPVVDSLRQLLALLLSYGFLLLANGLFTTLLSLRGGLEGFSALLTGVVMSCYYLGLFLGARYAALVVNQVGHIRAFGVFASLLSVTPLIHMLLVSPALWVVLRVVAGFSMAGLIVVTESWINARAENSNRGTILSIYMFINYLCAGCAQLLLMLDDPGGFRLFTLASIVFSFSLIPVLLTRTQAPLPEAPGALKITPVLRASPVGFFGAMAAGLINASFYTMGPLFATGVGFELDDISLFMALGILGGLALQTPIGKLSDRIERRAVIATVGLGVALCCLTLVLLSRSGMTVNGFLLGSFVYGSLSLTLYSLSGAHANDWGDPARRMQTSGALLAGFGIGAVVGPLLAGWLMGWMGPSGLFAFNGAVALALALFALAHAFRPRRRAKVPFVPQPAAQFTSEQLYNAAQQEREQEAATAAADGGVSEGRDSGR
ncbi:MFS transporter [Motiliproteus sediminis]|uniref:MFS transporter n=1 Tax=Motiliproteus sediminis TaxID=1468178 RepID=UPI001AEFB22C|nr:MFS transporter [Motiliproteus sediminis]